MQFLAQLTDSHTLTHSHNHIQNVADTTSTQHHMRFALASAMPFKTMSTIHHHRTSSCNTATTKDRTKFALDGKRKERTEHSCCDCPVRSFSLLALLIPSLSLTDLRAVSQERFQVLPLTRNRGEMRCNHCSIGTYQRWMTRE